MSSYSPERCWFTADYQHAAGIAAHGMGQGEDFDGVERVAFDQCGGSVGRCVGFNDVKRSGCFAARDCVYEDGPIAGFEKGVGEIDAADAEIDDFYARREWVGGEQPGDVDAKGIIAEEDVADAGDKDLRGGVHEAVTFGAEVSGWTSSRP
jgi:hypothetical protein